MNEENLCLYLWKKDLHLCIFYLCIIQIPMSFVCYVENILVNKQVLIQQIISQVFYLEFKSARTIYIYIYIYEQSHSVKESHYESIAFKGWFMPPEVKLGATGCVGQTSHQD